MRRFADVTVSLAALALLACSHHAPPARAVEHGSPAPTIDAPPSPDASSITDASTDVPTDVATVRDAGIASVRDVDWCNQGYGPPIPVLVQCEATELVSHREGEGPHSRRSYRFVSVTYGDLNGDRRDDALVLLEQLERPLIIQPHPTTQPEPVLALFDLRAGGLYAYPVALPGRDPVVRIGIAGGEASITRRVRGRECTERWTLRGESLERRSGC